jgi:hypothetical protein
MNCLIDELLDYRITSFLKNTFLTLEICEGPFSGIRPPPSPGPTPSPGMLFARRRGTWKSPRKRHRRPGQQVPLPTGATPRAAGRGFLILALRAAARSRAVVNQQLVRSQSAVNPQSIHSQSAVNPQSIHSQSAVNPQSIRSQSAVNPQSSHSQPAINPTPNRQSVTGQQSIRSQSTVEPPPIRSQSATNPNVPRRVIPNQSADWCGNPYPPSLHVCGFAHAPAENGLPRRCAPRNDLRGTGDEGRR